jgi:hypothetical protein
MRDVQLLALLENGWTWNTKIDLNFFGDSEMMQVKAVPSFYKYEQSNNIW